MVEAVLVEMSSYYYKKCKKFAEERISSSKSLYAMRGESKVHKMIDDVTIGTLAEWAVFKYLVDQRMECTKPDMAHYAPRQKSYSADLVCGEMNIHVKSQSVASAKKYGASWLFQKTDKLFINPGDNEYVAFCLVDGRDVEIMATVKVKDIVKARILAEPKVWRYKDTKMALYLDDVLEKVNNLWRI